MKSIDENYGTKNERLIVDSTRNRIYKSNPESYSSISRCAVRNYGAKNERRVVDYARNRIYKSTPDRISFEHSKMCGTPPPPTHTHTYTHTHTESEFVCIFKKYFDFAIYRSMFAKWSLYMIFFKSKKSSNS